MSAVTPQSDMPTPTTDKITQAAMETIYLCKFRVSMDGEWLCLRELDDISLTPDPEPTHEGRVAFSTWGGLQLKRWGWKVGCCSSSLHSLVEESGKPTHFNFVLCNCNLIILDLKENQNHLSVLRRICIF